MMNCQNCTFFALRAILTVFMQRTAPVVQTVLCTVEVPQLQFITVVQTGDHCIIRRCAVVGAVASIDHLEQRRCLSLATQTSISASWVVRFLVSCRR